MQLVFVIAALIAVAQATVVGDPPSYGQYGCPAEPPVDDPDCAEGTCGGKPGVPECSFSSLRPTTVFLYAADAIDYDQICHSITTCMNFGREPITFSCDYYPGHNPLQGEDETPLCSSPEITLDTYESKQCTSSGQYPSATRFAPGGDANCPPFEGFMQLCSDVEDSNLVNLVCETEILCKECPGEFGEDPESDYDDWEDSSSFDADGRRKLLRTRTRRRSRGAATRSVAGHSRR